MTREKLLAAADAAEAAANARSPEEQRAADMAVMRHQEAVSIGLMYAQLNRLSDTPHGHERLPLRDEGDDIGFVEARIPKELFFRLGRQKNFGFEAFHTDEGMRDLLKAHPAFQVKTVTGKTTVPVQWQQAGEGRKAKVGVRFGRGTMKFAV